MHNQMKRRNALTAYLFLAPAILGLVFITILPMFGVIGISLTDWSGLMPPKFIGLENYKEIFTKDFYFYQSVAATLYFAFGAVISSIIVSFVIALLLNQKIPCRGVWRSIFFLPYIVPAVGSSIVWSWMYESNFGVFNYFLGLAGIPKVQWLQGEHIVIPALIIMTVWASGNFIVIFLAGLQNVPSVYLEAIEIDGGNAWHKFRHVILPLMTPVIFFNFLMSIVANLQVFVPIYTMTKGGPSNRTLSMVYLMYREGFMRNNFGHASALSLVFFVFIALLTAVIFGLSNRWVFYEGEK